MQVSFRISALESWMYKATPQWVFDAGAKGYDAAGWAYEPDYDDPVFLEKVENFVRAMAERYNGNPNVAFVDIGHMGMWGEGHSVATTPKHGHSWSIETQKKMIDLYCRHFTKTQLAVSDDYAGPVPARQTVSDHGLRLFEGRHDARRQYPRLESAGTVVPRRDGTTFLARDAGRARTRTLRPVEKRGNWDSELLVESVEAYHASYMSIHWWPREELAECREAIDRINRRIGYRLRMDNASWPQKVALGEAFTIESAWSNAGVAPCYKGGFPCFTLKDARGGIVSVLVDDTLDVGTLPVAAPEQASTLALASTFTIAPRFTERGHCFFRACAPGTYDLYVRMAVATDPALRTALRRLRRTQALQNRTNNAGRRWQQH